MYHTLLGEFLLPYSKDIIVHLTHYEEGQRQVIFFYVLPLTKRVRKEHI